jgi:hypothetical protein
MSAQDKAAGMTIEEKCELMKEFEERMWPKRVSKGKSKQQDPAQPPSELVQ